VVVGGLVLGCRPRQDAASLDDEGLRVMTYNIEDVRTADLRRSDHPRLQRAAGHIRHLDPDILLVNEMTYDQPGGPGSRSGDPKGHNAQRFVHHYLASPQADSLDGLSYQPVMLPVNTGVPSGHDLNNDGRAVSTVPDVPASLEGGSVAPQTDAGRAYGNDAWGFGTFPGQYGMALFVRKDLTVLRDSIRTFREFRWHENARFVVMGDLNADPDDRSSFRDAIRALIGHERVNGEVVPTARPGRRDDYPDLDPHDTARWQKRIDYVLPSGNIDVDETGVWRPDTAEVPDVPVSDHFPVWMDVRVAP